MKGIKIKQQLIRLEVTENISPEQALKEAQKFCAEFGVEDCELDYFGYLFDIEVTMDINEKLEGYRQSLHGLKLVELWK